MKKFNAVIKATTDSGAKLNYQCTKPIGLLTEAISFAAITGIPKDKAIEMVNSQYAVINA